MAPALTPAAPATIGQPIDRRDGRAKVLGTARYAADQPVANVAHAVLVTSTIASGRIARIETGAAQRSPGVLLVLSHENAQKLPADGRAAVEPPSGRVLTLLQDDRVRYHGQPIAVVVGDTLEHAKAGAEAVRVSYAGAAARLDFAAARATARPPKTMSKGPAATTEGDVAGAFAGAPATIDATYTTPMVHHNPMEPHATTAVWDGDHLTIYDATQSISGDQKVVAKTLGLDPKNVHVVCPFVGGGFGGKGSTWSHVVLAAMAARQVARPVKLVLERPQMWGPVGGRPMTEQRLMLAAGADGHLVATRHDVISHTSSFEEFVETSALATRITYASATRATSHRLVDLDVGTPTFQRAPGEATGMFALESAIDEVAIRAGIDPLEFRMRNYTATSPEGKPWSSKALMQCYRTGAARFGWPGRPAQPASRREGDEWIGYGVGTATYPANRSKASARATVGPDGIAIVRSGTQDLGTGTWTVMAQVAADTLGFTLDKVRFELGDSDYPEAPGSGGSRSAASVAPAVQTVCVEARAQLIALAARDAASPLANVAALDMTIENGWFRCLSDPSRREPVAAVMRRAQTPIDVTTTVDQGADAKQYAMHSFGAVFAEVRVDVALGRIRVPRVVAVYDVGNRLNAKTAHSQLMGGIVWGIGMALLEESLLDLRNGRFVNASLAEYHVPVNADIGTIDVSFVDAPDPHINALGIRGIGEIGITGIVGAVANAVYDATGRRVRDLPIKLDKVLVA